MSSLRSTQRIVHPGPREDRIFEIKGVLDVENFTRMSVSEVPTVFSVRDKILNGVRLFGFRR